MAKGIWIEIELKSISINFISFKFIKQLVEDL